MSTPTHVEPKRGSDTTISEIGALRALRTYGHYVICLDIDLHICQNDFFFLVFKIFLEQIERHFDKKIILGVKIRGSKSLFAMLLEQPW